MTERAKSQSIALSTFHLLPMFHEARLDDFCQTSMTSMPLSFFFQIFHYPTDVGVQVTKSTKTGTSQ